MGAMVARLAHDGGVSEAVAASPYDDDDDSPVLGVREARDGFSDLVMRAATAGYVTRISHGRSHRAVAAVTWAHKRLAGLAAEAHPAADITIEDLATRDTNTGGHHWCFSFAWRPRRCRWCVRSGGRGGCG